jgi:hypothetical protein
MKNLFSSAAVAALLISAPFTLVRADQQILDDLIVDGSACIGQDCVNGESFGFDTLRLKENNLRIKAQDTSSSASFPTNDWQITFNDSSNGGANKFSIDDIDGGRTPFTIEAGAPSDSLYVEDGGRVGLGTNTPVVQLHIKDGNTPTTRLEQDGSSGFAPQTWDVAGNEANFFIRDATNGSTLPFRIRPGAPTGAIDIQASGAVEIGEPSSGNLFLILKEDTGNWSLRVNDEGTFSIADDESVTSPFFIENEAPQSALSITATGAVKLFNSATSPTAIAGGLYYNTTSNVLCYSNGTSWFKISDNSSCL